MFQKPQLAGLFLFLIATSGQTRIQPKPGAPAVTIEGDVAKEKEIVYVFQAKAGMKFSGRLTTKAGKAGFSVEDDEGKGLPEEEFDFNTNLTGSLTKAGDYKVSVATFDAGKVHFILRVRVHLGKPLTAAYGAANIAICRPASAPLQDYRNSGLC